MPSERVMGGVSTTAVARSMAPSSGIRGWFGQPAGEVGGIEPLGPPSSMIRGWFGQPAFLRFCSTTRPPLLRQSMTMWTGPFAAAPGKAKRSKRSWTEIGIVHRPWTKIGIVYRSEKEPAEPPSMPGPVNWAFARELVRVPPDETGEGPGFRPKPIHNPDFWPAPIHNPDFCPCVFGQLKPGPGRDPRVTMRIRSVRLSTGAIGKDFAARMLLSS